MIRELTDNVRSFRFPFKQQERRGNLIASLGDEVAHFFRDKIPTAWTGSTSFPAVDVIEQDADFKIRVETPGIDPENVDVLVTDGFLTIRGEKEEEKVEKDIHYLRRETSYGPFNRKIALPATADSNRANASFKNGVLIIQVPKKHKALLQPRKLPVKKAA